jgi:FdhD protein
MLLNRRKKAMDNTEKLKIIKVTEAARAETEDVVTREFPLTILFNDNELVTLLCTPADLGYLAVGFLASEGFITSKDEIKRLLVDDKRGIARVESTEASPLADDLVFKRFISSGCGRGASFYSAADVQDQAPVESQVRISAGGVFTLMKRFQQASELFRATGGVHSAALCRGQEIVAFAEDIGRHNAIDKIFGRCLLEDISIEDTVIVTSGRISSEILLKVARRNMPVIISKSAPTDLGVKLATDLGITLIGFVRGRRMNVYSHSERVTADD